MKLERTGRLNRDDAFAGLLVSIASDIRQKHHLRKMQRQNAVAMERAHEDMERKQIGFEEQIKSYHQFIDSSMASLQKGYVQCVEWRLRFVERRKQRSCPSSISINAQKQSPVERRNLGRTSILRRIYILEVGRCCRLD